MLPDSHMEAVTPITLHAVPRPQIGSTEDGDRGRVSGRWLPRTLTPLIGREGDVAEISALLVDAGVRLLTLTGPGGVGKTRVALRVAEEVASAFSGSVVFVQLAVVEDARLVLSAIARSLDVREVMERDLRASLAVALGWRRTLLVLDNFEHVLAAAPDLASLLQLCPELSILATSRAPLHIQGERRFSIAPLILPEPTAKPDPSDLAAYPAVTLFIERARSTRRDFRVDDSNASAIAAICRRLDGLPLAIELAAAWVNVLPPAALLARIEQQLPLPGDTAGGLQDRHRTMHDAIAWSYDLLTPQEARLLRQLAVFVGGFSLAEASAVAADLALPSHPDGGDFLGLLARLIDKSLLSLVVAQPEPRYAMLETVREFALGRLRRLGEEADAARRHAGAMVALVERAAMELPGPGELEWTARLSHEIGNIRAALAWGLEHDASATLRIGSALWHFWYLSGLIAEGLTWLQEGLERAESLPTAARARATVTAASLAMNLGDFATGNQLARDAVAHAQDGDDPLTAARALWVAGFGLGFSGETGESAHLLTESLRHFAEGAARATVADQAWASRALTDLGMVTFLSGDGVQGQTRCEQGIAQGRASGSPTVLRFEFLQLSALLLGRGDSSDRPLARQMLMECLTLSQAHGGGWFVTCPVAALAELEAIEGDPGRAMQLAGAAEELADRHAFMLLPPTRAQIARATDRAELLLGAANVVEQRALGRRLPEAEAIAMALCTHVTERAAAAEQAAYEPEQLTSREREVLRLLVAGQTDKEIAATLGVSHRTASNHVTSLRGKFGVASRTAVVAIALRDGLG